MNKRVAGAFLLLLSFIITPVAFAHQPVQEKEGTIVLDPTATSVALYGALSVPGEIDSYTFTPAQDAEIPIEVLVPVRPSNTYFMPAARIMPGDILIPAPTSDRAVFFEPFSVEKLYHGVEQRIAVSKGVTYTVSVFDPRQQTGDYSLGMGTIEDFKNVHFGALLGKVFSLKVGLASGEPIPWLDIFGLFILIAGFIIGLGAVTVIDLHGFLGRKSSYWTEATTRTHKVTKPLIWIGLLLVIIGACITYRVSGFSGVAVFQLLLVIMLILNGLFLSFRVSPFLLRREKEGRAAELLPQKWQRKIVVSFCISFIAWWGLLFLVVWSLAVTR